jgi:hypothetical protein
MGELVLMGLDMNIYKIPRHLKLTPTSYSHKFHKIKEYLKDDYEIAYWRKHYKLHEYFAFLCFKKGGVDQGYCEVVELVMEDLNKLEEYIEEGGINYYEHIFFPDDEDTELYRKSEYNKLKNIDLKYIREAKQAIRDGFAVYYVSSW